MSVKLLPHTACFNTSRIGKIPESAINLYATFI